MRPKLLMFVYFVFIIGTIFNLAIEGVWIGTEEVTTIQSLTGFSALEVQTSGAWAIPKQVIGFFTHGIPSMITWDYSYLDSEWGALFKWVFLYPISIGVIWGLVQVFLPVVQGLFSGVRTLLPF